jgi:hypothetical protein
VEKADCIVWFTYRKHFGIIPDYWAPLNGRGSALESIFKKFGDRKTEYVVAPEQGMEFDSLGYSLPNMKHSKIRLHILSQILILFSLHQLDYKHAAKNTLR